MHAGRWARILSENAPVAQLDRALDYESRGQEFESLRARHFSICYRRLAPQISRFEPASCLRRPLSPQFQFAAMGWAQEAKSYPQGANP
jgi:hypothetical protein